MISQEMKEHYSELEMMRGEEADGEKEEEEGELIIDDQTAEECEEEKPASTADLASISNLLNTANNQTFNQYFNSQDDAAECAKKEENDIECGSDDSERNKKSSENGEKMSAYSSAPHKIACPFCARKFPWESSLKRHILTHTGQKPFKCRDCPLWFTTKSNCDRHQMRKHDNSGEAGNTGRSLGERPFKATTHLSMDLSNGNNGDEMSENDDDGIVSSYFKCHLCDEVCWIL